MKLTKIEVENFRCFTSNTFDFADETIVRAFNGSGKSSIAEAVVWCLYGTNIMGKTKSDTLLLREGTNNMRVVTEWETTSGEHIAVERVKPEKGAVKQFVNGNKVQPGQVETLFFTSVKEFLSVFMPGYFSTLEPKEAKAIIARNSNVTPENVIKGLITKHRDALKDDKFGMGYDSIEVLRQKVSSDIREHEDDLLRYEGEISTYDTILKTPLPEEPQSVVTEEHKANAEAFRTRIKELNDLVQNLPSNRADTQEKLKTKLATFSTKSAQKKVMKDTCPTCKQKLQGQALEDARTEVETYNASVDEELLQIKAEGTELRQKLEELQAINSKVTSEEITKLSSYVQRVDAALEKERDARSHYNALVQQRNNAEPELERLRDLLKVHQVNLDGLKVKLDAIKAFRSQYVRLQQEKMDGLFNLVKIQLMRANEDGEIRDAFSITWKDKPYQLLSKSEKARCDIEIGHAISQWRPNPEPFPVFVDDAEGIQNLFALPYERQIIAAYVYNSQIIVEERQQAIFNIEQEMKNLRGMLLRQQMAG